VLDAKGRALRSQNAACLWIPLYALRCEEARRPDLAGRPTAVLTPEDSRRIWQASSLARRQGVKPGLTVSQAIGLCPALALLEPDPVFYDEQFARLLLRLEHVSPVIEPAELGRVYVGTDGLERLFGPPRRQLQIMAEAVGDVARLGCARGKFTAWVAAAKATPGNPVVVSEEEQQTFLRAQPVAALPLHPDNHRRLQQLGLKTLGDLAALPEAAVVAQFGREGRAAWRGAWPARWARCAGGRGRRRSGSRSSASPRSSG